MVLFLHNLPLCTVQYRVQHLEFGVATTLSSVICSHLLSIACVLNCEIVKISLVSLVLNCYMLHV